MGVSIHYWAVPPSSTLFRRLQRDKAFATLMTALFPYGNGIFFFFDGIDSAEREEILEGVIDGGLGRLGAEPEARRLIDEFRLELERTRLAYSGIEHRRCSLEKTCFVVEERLSEALMPVRRDAAKFVRKLVYGDQALGRDDASALEGAPADPDYTLGLIAPSLVKEGAQALSQVDEVQAFANDPAWEFDDFQRWRTLYQDVAVESEALLVGVC